MGAGVGTDGVASLSARATDDAVVRAREEAGRLGAARRRLCVFLTSSKYYKAAQVLESLPSSDLLDERIIVLQRLRRVRGVLR